MGGREVKIEAAEELASRSASEMDQMRLFMVVQSASSQVLSVENQGVFISCGRQISTTSGFLPACFLFFLL